MKRAFGMLGALGLGASLVYLMDPTRGPRRRQRIKVRATSAAHQAQRAMRRARSEVTHRIGDVVSQTQRFRRADTPSESARVGEPVGANAGAAALYSGDDPQAVRELPIENVIPEIARRVRRLSPAARFALACAGLGLFMMAKRRGGLMALPLGLIAASMLSRGATPRWNWGRMRLG